MNTHLPPVDAIEGPPGIGKTGQTLRSLGNRRALVLVGRHDLAAEASRLLPGAVVLNPKVRSVNGQVDQATTACLRPHEILRFRQDGRGREEGLVCGRCPDRPRCPYYGQFEDKGRSWIAVHDYLVLALEWNDPEIVVIDESIFAKVVEVTEIDFRQLLRMRTFFETQRLDSAVKLIDALLDLMKGGGVAAGPTVIQWICMHFGGLSQTLREVVDDAVLEAWATCRAGLSSPGPDNFHRLFEALSEQSAALHTPGRIWIYDGKLTLYTRLKLNLPSVPTIVLDSGADELLMRHLFPGRPLRMHQLRARSSMRLLQVKDGRYGKTSLRGNMRARASLFKQVRKLIERTLANDPNHRFGVITFKEFVPELERVLEGVEVVFGHFWAEKGTNRFKDAGVKTLFVIGTPTPNPQDLHRRAAGFFFPDQHIGRGVVHEWRRFEMDGDLDYEVKSTEPKDPLLHAFLKQSREFELMQAVGRIRPFQEGSSKTVVVFSPIPIPHFPPTRLCSRSELNREFGARSSRSDAVARLQQAMSVGGACARNAELAAVLGLSVRQVQRLKRSAEGVTGSIKKINHNTACHPAPLSLPRRSRGGVQPAGR